MIIHFSFLELHGNSGIMNLCVLDWSWLSSSFKSFPCEILIQTGVKRQIAVCVGFMAANFCSFVKMLQYFTEKGVSVHLHQMPASVQQQHCNAALIGNNGVIPE